MTHPPTAEILRQFAGYLTAELPELHHVEMGRMAEAVERFLTVANHAPPVPASGCAICGTPAATGIEYQRGTLKLCGACYTDLRQSCEPVPASAGGCSCGAPSEEGTVWVNAACPEHGDGSEYDRQKRAYWATVPASADRAKAIGGGAKPTHEDDSIREWACGCYEDQGGYHFCAQQHPLPLPLIPAVPASAGAAPLCADTRECCRELTRVWIALGSPGFNNKSASEQVRDLRAALSGSGPSLPAPAWQPNQAEDIMRAALQRIADPTEPTNPCRCEHDGPECCANSPTYDCPICIAAVALRDALPSPPASPPEEPR
jgi:hypothetical protein